MNMYTLDSLSLTRAATEIPTTKQHTTLKTTTVTSLSTSLVLKKENNVDNLISIEITPTTTIKNNSYEMTTNKYKQLQQQQQNPPEPQQQQPINEKENVVFEKFMNQITPTTLPHKIKEMIKNNNENLNDEIAMTTIENNTTIADNTMPQEQKQQQQQLKQNNENYNTNENSNATEWGKVPAENNCKCQYNYSDTNTSTTTTTITTTKAPKTTNSNVATTNATNTTTDTTANSNNNNKSNSNTFKVLNVDNVDSNQKRMEEILLTNIQNNVNLNNTFVLPTTPGAAAPTKTTHKTLQNVNTSGSFCCCYCSSTHDKGMREFACEGMFPPRQITKHSCNLNNNSQCIGATCDNSNGCGVGGGSCCHNGNNDSNSNNNNDNILNTNSLVTVECSLLTCENEREQEIRKEIQNGYKNSGNIEAGSTTTDPNTTTTSSTTTTAANNNKNNTMATKTIAEFSANLGEEFYFSPCSDSEKFENPIGNLVDTNVSIFDSPVDSVLENFEKFLNAVRLENQNLNQNVPECNDLIDLSDESMGECDKKDNVIQHKCNKLERNESTCNALLTGKSENIKSIENLTKQTCSDSNSNQIHVNNNEKSGNFENLLYCDLNETLEEQNLLESKEILQLTTATATTTAELTKVETAKIIKTLNKVNELERADNKNNENNDEQLIPIQNDNNYNYNNNIKEENNILMVDEVNETITKTPVTCINVYTNTNNSSSNNNNNNNSSSSNENRNNKNNSQEQQQHETCAVIVPTKETCQNSNSNSCNVKFVTTTAEAATIATTTTQTNKVPLEIVTTKNKIRSSSSIENISPQTQNKIQNQKQKQKESVSIDTNTTAANTTKTATTTSISFLTTNTQTHQPKSIQTANIVEYKNYIHHLEQQQQQQQEESKTDERIQQDQFTSAYTLRDFAKCLKPSADEDIIYTFNSIQQNQNEKEKLQKFQFNLNSNKQEFNSNESVSSAIKSINFSEKNEKQVNLSEFEEVKVNENNLYNNILKPDNNGINHSPPTTQPTTATTNSFEFENKSELNSENFVENQKLVKLKDTQFLEIENLSTPHFFQNRTKQSGLDSAQKADKNQDHQHQQQPHKGRQEQEKGEEFHHKVSKENVENFDNELKFNCNEKIYTREKNFQPLLYLTFLWPTKNEGQVVTTRRQGNDKQGDNEKEIEKGEQEQEEQGEEEQEVEVEKSQTEKEYRFNRQYNNESNNNNNKNVVGHDDDECDCNCKFAQRRELEKTYGTCNKKHVEDTQKGRHQILKKEREQQNGISNNDNKNEGNDNDDNNNDDDGDLCEQRILIDKQKREYKNQCLHKTETKSSENFQKILKNPTNLNKSENCTSALQKNINQINSYEIKENAKENSILKENFPTSEKCVLQSENCENINDNDRENVIENFKQIKSVAIDINRNNPNLNKTESVYNQDKNIKQQKQQQLNLNKSLKRLNETNQSIQNQIHATYTPTTTNNNNHHHQHQHHYHFQHPEFIEKSAEDQLNLEEFEASQRLKRLLQQHQQFRIRYDTTIPILSTQFDNYKQNNAITTTTAATTTTSESLKTDIARHSKEIPKGNLFISNNNNNNNNNQDEGVAHTNTLTTSTTTTTSKTKTTTTKEKLNTITETAPTTATTETKANKLEADCETTLERSSLLLLPQTNEHQQQEYKQGIIAINKNPKEQKKNSNLNLKDKDKEQVQEDNEKEQEIVKRIDENVIKVTNNKEINENKSNSPPLAYVSKKIVRLSQQKQHQTHQRSLHNTNPLIELTSTDKQEQEEQKQQQQQIQQNIVVIEKSSSSSTLRFPIEKDLNKTEISQKSSPSKLCNINLQHIVKTKQLLQQEKQQQVNEEEELEEEENCILLERKNSLPTTSDCQLNEYKSAFVPTKPEIYKSIKPLTGTTGNLTAPIAPATTTKLIPLIPVTASLSEFDTQRFSDFLYLNNITNTLNNNNNNNNTNTKHQIITHVLPIQQQQQQLYQQYPLYATNYEVDTIELPYCYDELLLTNETQQNFNQNDILNVVSTPLATSEINNNPDHCINDIENDDLISISSTNSSPCDCINCQQQQQTEQEIDRARDRDRERLYSSTETNVIPVVSLNENEALELTQQQQQLNKTYKMREVNGQLRGLLKKPNRPPPTRKNRVVFDETRNEFFEADYIILIREDCAYDEEDEEPCTCGEHELVRLCCEEGCQCNYSTAPATTDDNRTPQSPKYAPPIEFVDEAALSPPDGYKDNGLKNTLGGALSGHIFGAQHLQQLQVIQRLQQQRAAMLAARNNSQIPPPPPPATANSASVASVNQQSSTASSTSSSSSPLTSSSSASSSAPPSSTATAVATTVANNNSINQNAATQQHSPDDDTQGVCTECAECAECAAKQLQQDAECNSPQCHDDLTAPLGVPAVALLPIHTSSPERRMTQKEIIAGEERPRYVLQAQYKSSPVSERRIVREATEDLATIATGSPATTATTSAASVTSVTTALSAGGSGGDSDLLPPALPAKPGATSINNDSSDSEKPPPIPPKESSPTTQISGILKGGKLWKQDSISQSDDQNNTTSEDEAGSTSNGTIKRSVRFVTEDISNDEVDGQSSNVDEDNQINELIPIKKHSTLFKNALRPNSAVQQLFPSTASHQTLTSEALRAFDESKRAGCLVSTLPGSAGDSDTLRRSMERNILRRSLIKKKAVKSDISLEERIKQLTCGIDEDNDELGQENGDDDNSKIEDNADLSHRDSPAGEENPQKFTANGNNSDKSFSPNSSVSSSSSGSSAYKKITEIFNRDKKNQEKIMEMEENPIVIIPQECRCPAAPDLGMGVQVPVVHTQIHRTPPRQTEPKRQFLSTLAPLTACVAGNKDDLSSYYTLAAAHHNQAAQNAHAAEYNLAAMMAGEQNTTGVPQSTGDEVRKVAPDVIAGTPGQEQQDELAAFAQQEANRTEKIKKRYGNEPANSKENNKEVNSDDDEGNDYGFNKRPSVRGIKPKFSSTNEILQQMQDQLSQQMPSVAHSQPLPQPMKSYTLPKQASASAMTKQLSQQQPSPQNVPHPIVATSQQQLPQQQQMCSTVAPPAAMQMPANAAIAQQQTEQRTWSFYSETGGAAEQQRLPVESAAAAMQQTYYQTLPAGAMFRHTMIHQHQQHGPEEAMLYAQNCQAMATTIEPQPHYGHYARSPTRRPESPPPLRNYHQTMVLIPYNAETYSQFAATNMDPKVAHIQRQNILEYQQVTQQTIRVPIGYALPGMQLHVVAGRGHAAQYATAAGAQTHHHQHQRIMTQRYQFAQEASMAGFSERGVPEGAAAVSHTDCASSGMVSPTTGQQIAMQQQQQQQLQQGVQMAQQQQQQQQQQQINCQQQQQQQQQQPQPQTQNNMQTAAQGSVYYAMNV